MAILPYYKTNLFYKDTAKLKIVINNNKKSLNNETTMWSKMDVTPLQSFKGMSASLTWISPSKGNRAIVALLKQLHGLNKHFLPLNNSRDVNCFNRSIVQKRVRICHEGALKRLIRVIAVFWPTKM